MIEIELDGKKVEVAEGRMHDHAAFGDFDLLAVEFDFNHLCVSRAQALTGAFGT